MKRLLIITSCHSRQVLSMMEPKMMGEGSIANKDMKTTCKYRQCNC